MTASTRPFRAVSDPVGLAVDLVSAIEHRLSVDEIRTVVTSVGGGRAKSRRLAQGLAERPAILTDGRSPAPRVVGDLLVALRAAGARTISPPCCAGCTKRLVTFQRRGQDWYCARCGSRPEPCAVCASTRPVSSRDRSGRPRCSKCPDTDGRDPITVIHHLILELDPRTGLDSVAAAVSAVTPRPSHRQRLAWALEEQPALLTGDGHLAPMRAILRFIDLLHAAGIEGVVRPACPHCHRVVRLDKPLDGVRVCRTCITHSRVEECTRCGARREPVTRDEHGRSLCANCFIADPANLETCLGCGRRRKVSHRTAEGPLCPSCPRLPVLTCAMCEETTGCGTSRATGLPWCPTCQHRSAICVSCGTFAPVISGTLTDPICADCTPPAPWSECPTCNDPDHPNPGHCARCLINERLNELMGTDPDSLPAGLQALRENIAAAQHPVTAMRWLTKASTAPLLSGLASGRIPLTHQGLDELPRSAPLDHLRQTLVALGALSARDETMVRLEAFINQLLAAETDTERGRLLHRYLIWELLARLRRRNNGLPTTIQQSLMIRRLARGAIAFLKWLSAHQCTLQTCQQADLEAWAADTSATYREEAGRLIRWARANKLTTCQLASNRWNGPAQSIDHEHRWDSARRLLHDGNVKPEDRLAGLLVLLYAQQTTAVSHMTTDQINASTGEVTVRFGRVPIQLPEPVAAIARTVLSKRKGHATIGVVAPSPWLFPGGQPGRPISTQRLTQRLNAIGIRPSPDRSTALFQLATEVPAAILARTLGIHTDVAVTWQRHSAGDWTAYAAAISHRKHTHSESSNT